MKGDPPLGQLYMIPDRFRILPVERAGLDQRTVNCLKAYGIDTIGGICDLNVMGLIRVPKLGKKSLALIKQRLGEMETNESTASTLTKREWFAGLAMQGYCAAPDMDRAPVEDLASAAVRQADALLAELNDTGGTQ
ncbi:MAG: DNA-directed RNA polymerase subunit alpha C-terminal domain-containing protein [Phycisphaerae bacterium]